MMWCSAVLYPENCGDDIIQCIRGNPMADKILNSVAAILFFSSIVFVTGSFLTIIIGVCSNRRRTLYNRSRTIEDQEQARLKKILIQQSIMYQAAFFVVWVSVPLRDHFTKYNIVNVVTALSLPLQGFLNALIFFYHKVHDIKTSNNHKISICQALYNIFFRSTHTNEIQLNGLTRVENEREDKEVNAEYLDESIDVSNMDRAVDGEDVELASSKCAPELSKLQILQKLNKDRKNTGDDALSSVGACQLSIIN